MAHTNIAIKHMFRNRRQAEGRKQREPQMMPGMEHVASAPLTFSYATKDEHEQRTNLFLPPSYDPNELVELPTSFKPDTELDPLPFSNEFAEGDKIRPWAHIRVPTYLAVSEWEGVDDSDFSNSWLLNKGEFMHLIQQFVGQQHPIDVNPLIPESEYTTYGALNQLDPGQVADLPVSDGYLFD